MRANRSQETKPELALRRAIHALGLRYRVSIRPLPSLRRTADIVFTRAKIAVFLDGCFWHGCPVHHTLASANSAYWQDKVRRNRERGQDTTVTRSSPQQDGPCCVSGNTKISRPQLSESRK
ncbi:hypothetical protein [Streptomyces werraensis]|uniref:hypothetical protein n=1 Tax=Streptomyces werraensis TaxID=68284 RepID=UPI0037CCF998